ncbi:MAG: OprO/OprP family phosphate-selective porin [Candidatus Binatia bacterium]
MRTHLIITLAAVLAIGMTSPWPVAGEETSVTEEILEILRSQHQITEEQYNDLRRKGEKEKKEARNTLRTYWKHGLHFETPDKQFRLKIGGRIQNDWAAIAPDGDVSDKFPKLGDPETGTEFRRARLFVSGTMYDHIDFKAQYDFAGGETKFKDVWLGMHGLPALQTVKVGHFKEAFSLEELTSSKHITFMERALPNVFAPSRNTGIAIEQKAMGGRLRWAAGAFRDTGEFGNGFGGSSLYNVTGRLTGLPWVADDGRRLLHLGVSYSHKFRSDDVIRFRQRPEAHLTSVRLIDTQSNTLVDEERVTKDLIADGVDLINPEVALVFGPVSLQSEYMHAFVNAAGMSNPNFYGVYVLGSYFLTGENRNYDRSEAAFGRVTPKHNFFGNDGGWGAWEIAGRYSRVDLNDAGVSGGKLQDVTAGINWYLNPDVRVTFNYVFANLRSVGDTNIVEGRFQIAF